ncbi:hypothetical protein Adu01nite_11690 [Paractinoplanes durhamensis]|uniref:Uncharacterized protein n=1 Tax=Paractinoplanes durhamensis TaxID=113563 RepID=A0ABQ3YR25_9ACTN|nr:hypothetical protein Adu01nite_11690 [Actinoplanes durhamensis]
MDLGRLHVSEVALQWVVPAQGGVAQQARRQRYGGYRVAVGYCPRGQGLGAGYRGALVEAGGGVQQQAFGGGQQSLYLACGCLETVGCRYRAAQVGGDSLVGETVEPVLGGSGYAHVDGGQR